MKHRPAPQRICLACGQSLPATTGRARSLRCDACSAAGTPIDGTLIRVWYDAGAYF